MMTVARSRPTASGKVLPLLVLLLAVAHAAVVDETGTDAAGAVNGAITGGFAFHTDKEKNPWWQVDLESVQKLDRVEIYNRESIDSARARTIGVLLSVDGAEWREVYRHDGTDFRPSQDGGPLAVPLEGVSARYVRLQVAEETWLHLDEVEVYGTADKQVNIALKKPARQSSLSEWSKRPPAVPWQLDKLEATADSVDPEVLGFDEIVFVKRKPYSSDHYYTDIDNGTSPDRFLPENGIYIYNLVTRQERPVIKTADMPGGSGFIGKMTLSFEARKMVFDFRENSASGFRVWEVNIDGSGLRQLSFPPEDEAEKVQRLGRPWHTDDVHPCYLPDGSIVFSSTRAERTVLCGGSGGLVAPVLHRMDSDGGNIEQLTQSLVSEFCPLVLDDGRIMYHRWEYIDKGARVCKTIWSMNPDGTKPQELYGVTDDTTTVYMYPQPLPGTTDRLVSVGTCHFPQGGCLGAIMLIDLRNGVRRRGPDPDEEEYQAWDPGYAVTNITPHVFVERRTEPGWHFRTAAGGYRHDATGASGYLYTHPYPVSEKSFLVSFKSNPSDHYKNVANAYGLYLIDTDGRHVPLHRDKDLSCWHPTPLLARKTPPEIQTARDPEQAANDKAICIVTNVYQGMDGVEPGEVKWLRINEAVPRYWSTLKRWGNTADSAYWKAALWPRVQWGVVPVEEDGSAQFTVPANRNIFFQALDKDFREIQRERTYVNYQPGEVRSCVGCHGRMSHAAQSRPTESGTLMALERSPSVPQPQPCDLKENGGDGLAQQVIHYPTDIQPIFDAKCVSCHGAEEPAGELRLTGELTAFYNTSYEELARKQLAGPIRSEFTTFLRGDQGNYSGATLPPKSHGGYTSVMSNILLDPAHPKNVDKDHSKMVTEMERMILNRWIDTNYQFFGAFYGRQHSHWASDDPQNPSYDPADFRRKASFDEAVSMRAPAWHR